ncbi:MAG: hypothetical protein OEZ11_11500 [Gammaproteobacteria bacterium]|nr:hypothetical protein [Gammaproteobacteria bacterium]
MMNSAAYPEDSRTAVVRIAIPVAYSDGSWHDLQRAHLEDIYRNIRVMPDADLWGADNCLSSRRQLIEVVRQAYAKVEIPR